MHIMHPKSMPKANRIKAGAVSYIDMLLVDNVSSVHWGFLLDQYFICRSRNPVLNILDSLKKNFSIRAFIVNFSTRAFIVHASQEKMINENLPNFRHLRELTVATGIHTHNGLLEQMDLRQCTDFIRIECPLDIGICRVRIRVIGQDAFADLFHALFYRQVSLRFRQRIPALFPEVIWFRAKFLKIQSRMLYGFFWNTWHIHISTCLKTYVRIESSSDTAQPPPQFSDCYPRELSRHPPSCRAVRSNEPTLYCPSNSCTWSSWTRGSAEERYGSGYVRDRNLRLRKWLSLSSWDNLFIYALFYTLLSGNADSKDHSTGIFFFSARLLVSHYYSHYEHEEHDEHDAQIPSIRCKWLEENLQLDFVRRGW